MVNVYLFQNDVLDGNDVKALSSMSSITRVETHCAESGDPAQRFIDRSYLDMPGTWHSGRT